MAPAPIAAVRRRRCAAAAQRPPLSPAASLALALALALLARGAAAKGPAVLCSADPDGDSPVGIICYINGIVSGATTSMPTSDDDPFSTLANWTAAAVTQTSNPLAATDTEVTFTFPSMYSRTLGIAAVGVEAGPIALTGADGDNVQGTKSMVSTAASTEAGYVGEKVACTTTWNVDITNADGVVGVARGEFKVTCTFEAGAGDDPHVRGFFGQEYEFCGPQLAGQCQGRAFNLLSHRNTLLNTLVSRHSGPDAWPYAGTWMTGFGLRYGSTLSLELGLATDVQYAVEGALGGGGGSTRALPVAGGFRALLAFARVNGKDVLADLVESGRTLELGGATKGEGRATVHFPAAKHAHDAASGPVAVITTPDFKITMLLEAGDIYHLNFQIAITSDEIRPLHGLLGQSLDWAGSKEAAVEGGDLDYAVEGGLLGTAFKNSVWGRPAAAAGRSARSMLQGAPLIKGLTAGGL
ncbi:MAG: hypothetical protein J3K34DRAFT_283131 [Monoraphidium minutum]|nr:MAG: hypothetical protein J3K34DRAFT_283131 [Monoraphidium minutum]